MTKLQKHRTVTDEELAADLAAGIEYNRESKTSLVVVGLTDVNRMASLIAEEGFSEEQTIKIGDPGASPSNVEAYVGQLIGPGPDIILQDGETSIRTWLFHPLDPKTLKVVPQVTHTVLSPHQLNATCMRLQALQQAHPDKVVQAAIMWTGMGKNRAGLPLNQYRSSSRLVNRT